MDNLNTAEKIIFPICSKIDLDLALKESKEQRKIIGYKIRVECSATVNDAIVDTIPVAKSIGNILKCKVEESDKKNRFYVYFDVDEDNKELGSIKIDELKEYLIAASLKNKVGYSIQSVGWGPLYKGQSIACWPGEVIAIQQSITPIDLKKNECIKNNNKDEILNLLCQFYGQTSVSSKVVYGFSLLEEIFAGKAEHILTKSEIKEILSTIDEIKFSCAHDKKHEKIKDILLNPNIMSKENRNDRIAQNISSALGVPLKETKDRVKEISKLRAISAHPTEKTSNKENHGKFNEAVLYIDSVIMKIH